MTGRHASEDAALKRAGTLRQHGVWPGVRRHADGSASLTFDPEAVAPASARENE